MPAAKTLNERDTKLVSWLGEAHAKEAELEADLTAHIALTQKPAYKKRLQAHLKETRDHKRRVAAQIKKLGGPSGQGLLALTGPSARSPARPSPPSRARSAWRARSSAAQAETHLRNAQDELREEHTEIAIYTRIEVLATEVGDRETAQLARDIRRDEERMAKYPHRRARTARQGRRSRRDPARPASRLLAARAPGGTPSAPRARSTSRARSSRARTTARTTPRARYDPDHQAGRGARHRRAPRAAARRRPELTVRKVNGGPAGLESGRAALAQRVRSVTRAGLVALLRLPPFRPRRLASLRGSTVQRA